jgi:hypothetical protein
MKDNFLTWLKGFRSGMTNADDLNSIKCSQYMAADSVLNVLKNFNNIKCK